MAWSGVPTAPASAVGRGAAHTEYCLHCQRPVCLRLLLLGRARASCEASGSGRPNPPFLASSPTRASPHALAATAAATTITHQQSPPLDLAQVRPGDFHRVQPSLCCVQETLAPTMGWGRVPCRARARCSRQWPSPKPGLGVLTLVRSPQSHNRCCGHRFIES